MDIHNHLVPGVDDGSASIEESLEALEEFEAAGVNRVVTTPHLYLHHLEGRRMLKEEMRFLRRRFDALAAAARAKGANVDLRFGQEVCAIDGASVRRVVDDPEIGLAGTRFMLVEFGFQLPGDPDGVIRTIREAGREIVVAHPERYRYADVEDGLTTMRRWVEAGAYLQVNLGSLVEEDGPYGAGVAELGWSVLEEGLAHLLSSDHHCRARPQILHGEIDRALELRGGADQAALLLNENARRILAGEAPKEVEPLTREPGSADSISRSRELGVGGRLGT